MALGLLDRADVVVRHRAARRDFQHMAVRRHRLVQLPVCLQYHAEAAIVHGVLFIEQDNFAVGTGCLFKPLLAVQQLGIVFQCGKECRRQFKCQAEGHFRFRGLAHQDQCLAQRVMDLGIGRQTGFPGRIVFQRGRYRPICLCVRSGLACQCWWRRRSGMLFHGVFA